MMKKILTFIILLIGLVSCAKEDAGIVGATYARDDYWSKEQVSCRSELHFTQSAVSLKMYIPLEPDFPATIYNGTYTYEHPYVYADMDNGKSVFIVADDLQSLQWGSVVFVKQ